VPAAFRAYEDARRARVAKVQAAARRNGDIYHKSGVEGFVRNAGMRVLGGRRLIRRYSWIYDWRLPKMAGTPAGSEPGLRNEVAATPDEESPTISAPNPRL
jgi:hypothetical protein